MFLNALLALVAVAVASDAKLVERRDSRVTAYFMRAYLDTRINTECGTGPRVVPDDNLAATGTSTADTTCIPGVCVCKGASSCNDLISGCAETGNKPICTEHDTEGQPTGCVCCNGCW